VRIRTVREGLGYRLYQVRKAGDRHLVDSRPVETLPSHRRIEDIQTTDPVGLIAGKITTYHQRRNRPKAGTEWRDLAMLLLAFPDLKCDPGPVSERLMEDGANEATMAAWREVVESKIEPQDEDSEFDY
jgi:hypothetical protein